MIDRMSAVSELLGAMTTKALDLVRRCFALMDGEGR